MKSEEWWAMYGTFGLLLAMLRYKALPGKRTEKEAVKVLREAAPYLGEQQVKELEKVLGRG